MQKYGGVSRYFYELKKSFNSVLPILISNNFYLEKSNLQYINYQTTNLFFRKFFSLINKLSKPIGLNFKKNKSIIIIIGKTFGHLEQSCFLKENYSINDGMPPEVNLLN